MAKQRVAAPGFESQFPLYCHRRIFGRAQLGNRHVLREESRPRYQKYLCQSSTISTMAPRLNLLTLPSKTPYTPFLPFLYPSLTQSRSASILSSLSDNRSAYGHRIRRGRGPSSGKGKTAGRGHKGQGQHGEVPAGFNGGQTPDHVVAGSRGFVNRYVLDVAETKYSSSVLIGCF